MIAQNIDWIKEGLYVDAKDKYQQWQVGLVIALTKTHIKIRFDGWSFKMDEIYPMLTQRLKPFRSITKGHTGQKKSPALRQHWAFTQENHELRLSQLQQFVSHLSQKSGFEMNQYLRGQNYFYIDFLLSQTYTNVQTIKKVYDYFKINFQFFKTYFQQFVQRDTNIWFQAGQKQQLTPKKVYAELHFEIFESIVSIIGSLPRCAVFIRSNERLLREMHGNDVNYETFIARELNSIQLLTWFDNVVSKVFNQTKNGLRNTPLSFINSLYFLFNGLQKLPLNAQFKKKINMNLVTVVQEYIGSLTVQDAKTNEKTIDQILNMTRIMCNKLHSEKEEICRWTQKSKFKLSLSMIQCDVLEKKLRGISRLKEFYELINRKLSNTYENSHILCTKDQFRQWMDEEQLMKTIFETNEHSEVIKKGCEMVHHFYVCKNHVCLIEDVVYIWETCFKKHEAIKRVVFQFWKDFAAHVTADNDWKLFIGVLTRNEEQINQEWQIEVLFGVLHAIKSDDSNESITDFIKMMYRKTLKDQKYIPQLAKELSYFEAGSKVFQSIVNHSLEQISKKSESIFHLKLLTKLYNEMREHNAYIPENIISVLIEELKSYVSQEENEKFVHTILNLFNEIMMAKFGGVSSGNPQGAKLNFENFETVWQIFSECEINQFKRIFFAWMVPRSVNSIYNYSVYQINPRFTHQFRLEIFSNILCDEGRFNYRKLDSYEFAVFKEFFIYANMKAGNLDVKNQSLGNTHQPYIRKIIRTKSKDIQGLKELWQIFKSCENDDVVVSCSSFLKDLYLRVSNMMPVDEKTERTKNLMETIQTSIIEGEKNGNYSLIKRILILISKLLMDIKQRIEIPKQFQRAQRTEKQTLTVYMTSASDAQQLQVYVEDPFINIKGLIAKKFHLSRDEFTLFAGKTQILKELYDLPYFLFSFDEPLLRLVRIPNEMGKFIMGNICQHVYHRIIAFLRTEPACMEAFLLLENLDLFEPVRLFGTLSRDIEECNQIIKHKKKLYLHIFFTRVFIHVVEKQIAQLDTGVLLKLISHLEIPIETSLIVNYLQKIVQILIELHKKNTFTPEEQSLITLNSYRPKIYILMLNLVKYMNNSTHTVSTHEIRLLNSSFHLYMTGFADQKLLFDTFIKDDNFREFMFEVFIKCEVLQVKKMVEKKVSTWLKEGFCSIHQERKVAQFFINQLYYAIYQKDIKKQISGAEFTGIFKLFRTIIESISYSTLKEIIIESPCSIETQVEDRPVSFSNHIFSSIIRQADSQSSPNFILNGQLQILVGMIRRDRQLINQTLVDYLFYQCLIYVHGKTDGMEVKCLFRENIALVLQILWYCMVNIEFYDLSSNSESLHAKPLNMSSKNKLKTLSLDKYADTILSRLREFHYNDEWRNAREWNIDFLELSRAKNDFVGLENPGCICYLNSLLQQLYMIQQFRSAVLNMDTQTRSLQTQIDLTPVQQDSPELITKLKHLFLNLMYSERSAIDPQFFTSSIRTTGNRPMVRIFQQMDIDEFSMILFDKIQSKIHRYKTPNFIRELFGGAYSNQIISQECDHSSERQEQFLSISLDVKKNITESFQSLVKGEMLEGENSYFCDGCDKKVRALKRLSIKRLPPHLIISLRRFEFDYEADQKIKINKYCEFPFELNLQNYSQNKLNESNQEVSKRPEHREQSSTLMNEEQPVESVEPIELVESSFKPRNNFPAEYFLYKLKGVVVHTGSADSGHYYSFIESENGGWFEFNDEKVTEFDVKNIGEEAYGGRDGEYAKIRNAYLLFYERKDKCSFANHPTTEKKDQFSDNNTTQKVAFTIPQNMAEQSHPKPSSHVHQQQLQPSAQSIQELMSLSRSSQLEQNKRIIEQIILENKKIRLWHFFFSKEYLEFVLSFIKQTLYPIYGIKTNEYLKQIANYEYLMPVEQGIQLTIRPNSAEFMNHLEHQLFQFVVSYTFLIQIRHKYCSVTFELLEAINKLFFEHSDKQKRYSFLESFLEQICQQSFFDEFFVNCSTKEKSKIVGNFIFQAIRSYLTICPFDGPQCLPKVVKTIIKLVMRTVIKTNTNITECLAIIRKLLTLKQQHPAVISTIIDFLLKKDFVSVMIDNTLGIDTPKDLRAKRVQSLQNDNNNPVQIQQKQQKDTNQRKNSDISAKDEEQGTPTKKKHLNEKIQIQGEEKSLDATRFSVLFGQYPEDAGVTVKTNDKEVWAILYEIQQEIKAKKQQIYTIKQSISILKRIPIDKPQPQSLLPQIATQIPQNPTEKLPQQKRNDQLKHTIQAQVAGTDQEESSEMDEQSEEDDEWNEQDESALNEHDMRDMDVAMRMVNQVYTEVVPVPKENIESETHVTGALHQTHVIDLSFCKNTALKSPAIKVTIDLTSQTKPVQQIQSLQSQKNNQIPQEFAPPKPRNQLSPEQQLHLSALQNLLGVQQKLLSEMEFKFYLPLNKLKPQKVMKILSEQKDTKSIIALAAFLSELVFNTLTFNDIILIAIQNAFKDYESSKYRPLFLVIEKLLEIEDDLAKKRRSSILALLKLAFRQNQKYFLECDFIQQFLLRYATRNPTFESLIRESPTMLNEMKNWITQKKTPSSDSVKKHRQPNCERLAFRPHGIIVSSDLKDYETLSIYKLESFEKIKQNRFTSNLKYSDYPKVREIYNKGDRVDVFFDNGLWTESVVEENFFGFLLLQFATSSNKVERSIISQEDEKIKLALKAKREERVEKMEVEK